MKPTLDLLAGELGLPGLIKERGFITEHPGDLK